jgi:hypothetical protein
MGFGAALGVVWGGGGPHVAYVRGIPDIGCAFSVSTKRVASSVSGRVHDHWPSVFRQNVWRHQRVAEFMTIGLQCFDKTCGVISE